MSRSATLSLVQHHNECVAPLNHARAVAIERGLLKRLLVDIRADLADYQQLEDLLQQQFGAALAHDAARLTQAGSAIVVLTEQLEERRQVRVKLTVSLFGRRSVTMMAVFALLPDAARGSCEQLWAQLVERITRCKALNIRNGKLLVAQHDAMEQILFGEKNIYVPL